MKNKLLIIIVLFTVVLLSACAKKSANEDLLSVIKKRDKIIVGVKFDAKPFGFIDLNGKPAGYDIDIAKYIAKTLLGSEDKVVFRQVTSSNRILALNSGAIDMIIATMTVTKSRQNIVDFSIPYYVAGQALLVPTKSDIAFASQLNGKKVIIVYGSTAEENLRLLAPDANLVGFKTYIGAYDALKLGKADAMFSDDVILLGFALSDTSIKLLPKRYTKEPYAIAFRKTGNVALLRDKVNFILDCMQKSGKLLELKEKWIKY